MLILNDRDKTITITIEPITCESTEEDSTSISYIIKAPKIVCNNKKDAEAIHQKLSDFAISTCRALLKEEK